MSDENQELDLDEHPLPASGDMPIKERGFNLYEPLDWNARAWGFKRAADILAAHVLATFSGGDLVIYPIIFLYRHQLELSLKEIIVKGNELLDEPIKLKTIHPLRDLWSDCRTVLERLDVSIDIPEVEHFEACISQLDRLDPQSMSFRYPVTKTGVPTLPATLKSVDLQNLQKTMDKMALFLDITREVVVQRTNDS
jgi:hypothetical protein